MRIHRTLRFARLLALAAVPLSMFAFSPVAAQTAGVTATLLWTAPGDDGTIGRAAQYDLRISTNGIAGTDTLSWWNAATIVNMAGKVPAIAGTADSMVVTGLLSSSRYYAIIRAADEVPNWSGFSNVAVMDTGDALAPARIVDLRTR